jgi:solute carrier family 8 (sodium/calcium exchanger)
VAGLSVDAQICNKNDPESGGNIVPAFSTGGARVCLIDPTDKLGLRYIVSKTDNTTCVRAENDPQNFAIVYVLLLFWTFAGVGMIADIFMDAIGTITSVGNWIVVRDKETGLQTSVKSMRWNPTVANLTLMALGSSAPEILLSVIEVASNDFYSGELGPSTIVGSAAFNGLMIISVCISALEAGDTRKIDDFNVFAITAFSSVFAYMWLLVILVWATPDIVTASEGALTFLFFPVLVIVAYLADAGYFSSNDDRKASFVELDDVEEVKFSRAEAAELLAGVNTEGKTEEELLQIAYTRYKMKNVATSRGEYRKQGVAAIAGKTSKSQKALADTSDGSNAMIGFECTRYSIKESAKYLEVGVVRLGDLSQRVNVQYTTKEDASADKTNRATEGKDYVKASGTLIFKKGQDLCTFNVEMIDDDEVEEDEKFLIELSGSSGITPDRQVCTVTILDDNDAGVVSFAKMESIGDDDYDYDYVAQDTMKIVNIRLVREEGTSGSVSVKWRTVSDDVDIRKSRYGTAGEDTEIEGLISFGPGEKDKYIALPLVSVCDGKETHFHVELFDPTICVLGELVSLKVAIKHDEESMNLAQKIADLLYEEYDSIKDGSGSYADQFKDAVIPEKGTGGFGLVVFYINAPWRLFFAFCPPPQMMGGWLCFFIALAIIAVVTCLIGDLASLLGCSIGLKDSITAITLVALGTSLPDTFASKAATVDDANADAAIGNVTGSNSVNVFLGLGLPWFIAALYWGNEGATDMWVGRIGMKNPEITDKYPGGGFAVPAGPLGFSVTGPSVNLRL